MAGRSLGMDPWRSGAVLSQASPLRPPRGPCPASSATASGGERDRLVAPTTPSGVLASLHDGPNRQSRFIIDDRTSIDDLTTEQRLAWPKASLLRHMPASSAGGPPFGGEASLWVWAGSFGILGADLSESPLTSWREEKYGTRASEKTRQLDKYEPYSTEG
jgi:hypothetical protein